MRDQSARDRQLRVRARMRTGHEAGVRSRRDHLHVHVRAEEAGLPDEKQYRSSLYRHVRLQRTMLGEGEPRRPSRVSHAREMHARNARTAEHARGFRFRSPQHAVAAGGSESHSCELLHFGECLDP